MAEQMAQQQTAADSGPADLSTSNQPAGTTRIDDGVAYDVTGKSLGQANVPGQVAQPVQQTVDLVAAAKAAGATPAPQQPVDLVAAAKAAGATPAPTGKTAPQQTTDLLTQALSYPIKAGQWLWASQEDIADQKKNPNPNTALVQAKNASDYIYNNVLGKDTYTHNNLTYDKTPSTFSGKVWQRLWGWATQDEINKLPGLEPDRVEMLKQTGNDILGRMFGKEKSDQLREHILNGSYVVNVPPEEFARAAAKSLTDFFSPGYYALSAFGKAAQGYQKAAQLAHSAGDMVGAARAMGKARLLGLLGVGINIPFTISQAHDLVENWDGMNVPERVAAVSGILGGIINTHVGVKGMGGYSEVAGDVKQGATVAAQATQKALGAASDKILQAAPDFVTAIERASSLTGRKYAEQKANIRAAAPELQAILNENPNLGGSPQKYADAIREWLQKREQVMLGASGGMKGSDVPVSRTLETDIRARLSKFFDENRGKFGNDQQVEEATEKIISRLMMTETAQGTGPAALRMPNAFEAENVRQGLNQEVKPQIGGEPTSNAYRAAAHETVKHLREAIDQFYHNNGIENVKEFRQKEATLIDVADRLEAAQKRADEMGNGTLWSSLAKKYKDPAVIATILAGSFHPFAFGALAPYLVGERVYHNYKNPGVNLRRAQELADPNAVPTDIAQNPTPPQGASFPPGGPGAIRPPAGPSMPPGGSSAIRPPAGPSLPPGGPVAPPAHPVQAAAAAHAVAPGVMGPQPTNHQLNSQLATHFGEPLNHEVDGQPVTLEDRIEQVKSDAEAMRRSGVDISKTQTGKMLGLINEHEQVQAAAIEKEQEKAHEDAKKVSEELHQEFQKLQDAQNKKLTESKLQTNQSAQTATAEESAGGFKLPFETSDEELPQSEAEKGRTEYTPFNTRLHELGHAIWSHLMGLRPFDVVSGAHEAGEGAHAVARTDVSRFMHPDGRMNNKAVLANLGDVITRFLAGGMAEEVHGGVPLDENTSTKGDLAAMDKMFDKLWITKAEREPIIQQAKAQLREAFTQPGMEELMKGFAEKRKAGLGPEYHFDETQMHQLRAALDKLKKGGNNEPNKPEPKSGDATGTKQQAGGLGGESDAGRAGASTPETGRLQQAKPKSGLVEQSTGNEEHDAAIRNGGGIPAGAVHVPGHGPYKMFHNPETGSTLTFKPSDAITPQTVGKQLAADNAQFAAGEKKKSERAAALKVEQSTAVAESPKDIVEKEGMKYKGELVKGSGVHMFEHPDHPGKTGALQEPFTVEDVRRKIKEKTEANMISSKQLEEKIQAENRLPKVENLSVPAERSSGVHDAAIKAGGGIPGGIEKGDPELEIPDTVLFHDPTTGSTLYLAVDKVTPENVRAELRKSRAQYLAAEDRRALKTQQNAPPVAEKEEKYHPALQSMANEVGTTDDAAGVRGGASFITPDGKFIHLSAGGQHPDAIEFYNPEYVKSLGKRVKAGEFGDSAKNGLDTRIPFVNDTGAIRTRFRTGRAGNELAVSVPKNGITTEQVDAVRRAVGQGLGRNGNLVLEQAERGGKSTTKEFASPADVEPMLRKIGAFDKAAGAGPATPEEESAQRDYDTEKNFATQMLSGEKKIQDFPHYDSYKKTVESEAKLIPQGSKVLFIGSGPVPLSSILLGEHGLHVDSLELDPETAKLGEKVARQAGLKNGKFMAGDARNFDKFGDYDAVVTALEAGPNAKSKNEVLQHVMDNVKPGTKVLARGTAGEGGEAFVDTAKSLPSGVRIANSVDTFDGYGKTHVLEPDVAQKASQMAKHQGGGFSIHPTTGEAPTRGYMSELVPERRGEGSSAEDIRGFIDKNKDVLAQNPNLHVGGWNNELNIAGRFADKQAAVEAAKKLDQHSIYDVAKGKEISTGGKNQQREFPNYPLDQRLLDLKQSHPNWETMTPDEQLAAVKEEAYANYSLDDIKDGNPWISPNEKKRGGTPGIKVDNGQDAGFLHPDGSISMIGDSFMHDIFAKEIGMEDTDAFSKATGSGTYELWSAASATKYGGNVGFSVTLPKAPTQEQIQAITAITKHLRAGGESVQSVNVSWPGKDVGVDFPTPAKVAQALRDHSLDLQQAVPEKPFESKTADELTVDDVNKNRWFINPDGTAVGSTIGWAATHQQVLDAGLVPEEGAIRVVDSNTFEIRKRPTEAQIRNVARLHKDSGRRLIQYELIPGDDDHSVFRETASIGQLQRDVDQVWPEGKPDLDVKQNAPQEKEQDRISVRVPSTASATESPLKGEPLTVDRKAIDAAGEKTQARFAGKVRNIAGLKIPKNITDPGKVMDRFVDHVADNLKFLHDHTNSTERENNAKWYNSANKIARDVAEKHGYTPQQTAGVVAAMSPQMDWDMNVSLTKRLTDIVKNHADEVATPKMMKTAREIISSSRKVDPKANAALAGIASSLEGKKYSELTDPYDKAVWARLYDEANNPRTFERIDPATGESKEVRTNKNGEPTDVMWGNLRNVTKAISILEDGSRENISNSLGRAHKVRSFYNNIIDPSGNDVTIDTHAVAAGLMQPVSGNSSVVKDNFGKGAKSSHGLDGTYALYAEAYRQAAKELNLKPRELQSIVWEKARKLFSEDWKTDETREHVESLWKKYQSGDATLADTRKAIVSYAEESQLQAQQQRGLFEQPTQKPLDYAEMLVHASRPKVDALGRPYGGGDK